MKGQPGHLAVHLLAHTTGSGLNATLLGCRLTGPKATLSEFACGAEDVGDPGLTPESGRPPGGGMATHTSFLAWGIPGTEELGRLQSVGLQRARQDWSYSAHTHGAKMNWAQGHSLIWPHLCTCLRCILVNLGPWIRTLCGLRDARGTRLRYATLWQGRSQEASQACVTNRNMVLQSGQI